MNFATFERAVGAPLDAVRAFLGATVVEVTPVSRVRPADAVRGAVRVRLADGRLVKLRRASTEAQARDVAALLEALDEPALPRALFVSGRVLVEPWVEGVPLDGHPELVRHAETLGALLGRVHTARVAGRAPSRTTASTDPVRARFERHVADLAAAGVLLAADADRARALVAATLPFRRGRRRAPRPLRGERRRDPAGRAVVVDNESVRVAELDGDSAARSREWPWTPPSAPRSSPVTRPRPAAARRTGLAYPRRDQSLHVRACACGCRRRTCSRTSARSSPTTSRGPEPATARRGRTARARGRRAGARLGEPQPAPLRLDRLEQPRRHELATVAP
jgi:hypothetical protein